VDPNVILPIEVVKIETGASSDDNDDADDDFADPSFEIDVPEKTPKIKRKRRTRSKYESDESEYEEKMTKREAKQETRNEMKVKFEFENDGKEQRKNFKCSEPNCGKQFHSQGGLDAHKRIHQGLDVSGRFAELCAIH
jgi:hypothetical protein